jgi:hypothetical protein
MTRKLILAATFLSAFLLFSVQPLFAKYLLPFYGGTATVWTISVFFYSGILLMGYLYASLLTQWGLRQARFIHSAILIVAASILLGRWLGGDSPLLVEVVQGRQPVADVLLSLSYAVGLPVLLLASTSVLAQHLYARLTKEEPYGLFALSNAGSLGGLAAYPFLIEPFLDISVQTQLWTGGFVVFLLLLLAAWRQVERHERLTDAVPFRVLGTLDHRWSIVLMAAVPTFILASGTELLSRGIASFPLLWVVPLFVYLLSFIIAFQSRDIWPWRFPLHSAATLSIVPTLALMAIMDSGALQYWLTFVALLVSFGLIATYFHRRIYELRPNAERLGTFYVFVTFGGAIGSGLVGLLMPFVFTRLVELHILLAVLFVYLVPESFRWLMKNPPKLAVNLVYGTLCFYLFLLIGGLTVWQDTVVEKRNFYGTVMVKEVTRTVDGEDIPARVIINGVTNHGLQALDDRYESQAASYYGPDSGIDLSVRSFSDAGQPPRISVIGLGAGMMNAYCDRISGIDYVEINPQVVTLAEEYFTYLDMCPEKTTVAIGDGRLYLEGKPEDERYQIIMLDAFSDDAIPAHLLTVEAFEQAYLPHLSADGIIAVHISNRYLDLSRPLVGTAREAGLRAVSVRTIPDGSNGFHFQTSWILLTRPDNLDRLVAIEGAELIEREGVVWTDGRYSVLDALSLSGSAD